MHCLKFLVVFLAVLQGKSSSNKWFFLNFKVWLFEHGQFCAFCISYQVHFRDDRRMMTTCEQLLKVSRDLQKEDCWGQGVVQALTRGDPVMALWISLNLQKDQAVSKTRVGNNGNISTNIMDNSPVENTRVSKLISFLNTVKGLNAALVVVFLGMNLDIGFMVCRGDAAGYGLLQRSSIRLVQHWFP